FFYSSLGCFSFFFFQAEDGIRDFHVTGVQTCALPISWPPRARCRADAGHRGTPNCRRNHGIGRAGRAGPRVTLGSDPARACRLRSEEHTSELQSRENLVCRLLLEKKKKRDLIRRSGVN